MSPIASTSPCSAETCGRGGRGCDRARAPPTHGLRSGRAHTGIGARRGPPRRRGRARGRSAAPAAPRAQRRLTCRRSSSCFCDIGLLPRPPILRSRCTGAPHPLHRAQCRPLLALSGPVAACASRLLLLHAASQPSFLALFVGSRKKQKPVHQMDGCGSRLLPGAAGGLGGAAGDGDRRARAGGGAESASQPHAAAGSAPHARERARRAPRGPRRVAPRASHGRLRHRGRRVWEATTRAGRADVCARPRRQRVRCDRGAPRERVGAQACRQALVAAAAARRRQRA